MNAEAMFLKIKEEATKKGISLPELAERCGRRSNFFYVFRKREVGLNTLMFWKQVSILLGKSLDELLGDNDE